MDSLSIAIPFVKLEEGFRTNAYPDPATKAEPYTIGYGSTYYPNGTKVKKGDKVTKDQAEQMMIHVLKQTQSKIRKALTNQLQPHQEAALLSLAYNIGDSRLLNSTAFKLIRANPNDPKIEDAIKAFRIAAGKINPTLVKRRQRESDLYFNRGKAAAIAVGAIVPLVIITLFFLINRSK